MHAPLRNFSALFVAFVLAAGAASTCNGGDGPSRTLFGSKAVQKELKLTDAQQKQVEAIVLTVETRIADAEKEATKASEDPRVVERIYRELEGRVLAEEGGRFMALLDKEQALRFWQIGAQSAGRKVFGNNRVLRVLQLSDDQKKAMLEHQDRMMQELTKIVTNVDLDIATVQARADAAERDCYAKMLGVLNEKQKKDFDALLGKPFDVKLLMSN